MKKIKFLIASMLGAIALVFACVLGTKVNAADVNNSYTFDITAFSKLSKTATTGSTLTATDADSGDSMSLSLFHKNVNGDSSYKNSNIEIQDKIDYFDIYFSFTSRGSGRLSFTEVTGGSSNYLYYLIDSDCTTTFDANNLLTEGTSNRFANGTVNFDFEGDGAHTVRIYSSTKPSSNFKISAITMTETYTASVSSDYELDSISLTNSKSYNLGDTFDSTAISVKGLYINKNDSSDTKELSIGTSDYILTLRNSSNETVTSFATAGTYTLTATMKDDNTMSDSCNISIANIVLYKFYNEDHTDSTDYSVTSGITIISEKKGERTNTFGSDTIVHYMQASEIDFTLNGKAEVSFYVTQTSATTNVNVRSYYIKDDSNKIIFGTGYTPVMKPSDGATVSNYQTIVLPA